MSYCPLLHYIPDRSFILNKNLHTQDQMRDLKIRKKSRNKNALKNLNSIKDNAKGYELSSSDSESGEEEEEDDDKIEEFKQISTEDVDETKKSLAIENESVIMNMKLEPIRESDEHIEETEIKSLHLNEESQSFNKTQENVISNSNNSNSLKIPSLGGSPYSSEKNRFSIPRKSKKSMRVSLY